MLLIFNLIASSALFGFISSAAVEKDIDDESIASVDESTHLMTSSPSLINADKKETWSEFIKAMKNEMSALQTINESDSEDEYEGLDFQKTSEQDQLYQYHYQQPKIHESKITIEKLNEERMEFLSHDKNVALMNVTTKTGLIPPATVTLRDSVHIYSDIFRFRFDAIENISGIHEDLLMVLNYLRIQMLSKFKLKASFQLSPWHLMFHFIYEQSNYMLESIIENVHLPLNDRLLRNIACFDFMKSISFNSIMEVVKKHGVVPLYVHPNCMSSSTLSLIQQVISKALNEFHSAYQVSPLIERSSLIERKEWYLRKIYEFLSHGYGNPVEYFDWRFEDRNGLIHRYENLNAFEFYQKFVAKSSADDHITITDDPNLIYGKMYNFAKEKALYEGSGMTILNAPIVDIKKVLLHVLSVKKAPVYARIFRTEFENSTNTNQVLSNDSYDFVTPFGIDLNLSRSEMLQHRTFVSQDPMIICGFNRDPNNNNRPYQWCGENFGPSGKGNGYFCIYDSYLDRNLISITVPIELLQGLSDGIYEKCHQDPIVRDFKDCFIP